MGDGVGGGKQKKSHGVINVYKRVEIIAWLYRWRYAVRCAIGTSWQRYDLREMDVGTADISEDICHVAKTLLIN